MAFLIVNSDDHDDMLHHATSHVWIFTVCSSKFQDARRELVNRISFLGMIIGFLCLKYI